ncbi:Enoyl-CoA hydratase/isomerase family protein [Azotobacter chroococcum NCIMB 8003]|uniref:Enoyl-CoA hydratase/isomerase family protein n=1 Tax=Azotobacter chroococcum NCIMB 8003 TaxID=1328314 RepID=A0A0C4WMF3_9GAMM|nr:Enoyl-CoA hydratase/isomerase family protein [Azotobacter chroococcum NCIMB 8003]
METGELLDRLPLGQQAVFRGLGVLVAQGDAADQQVVLAQGQVPAHDGMERGEGSLGAAVQPLAAGGDEDVLDEHAEVHVAARFGQPEVRVGTLPGAGGTQRLTRAIGKAKAMDMCLTGRSLDAEEALRYGLVSRVVPLERLLDEALSVAAQIAGHSAMAVRLNKEAVNRAHETTLAEGVRFERRLLHASFATEDRREGMQAFAEKRPPQWTHR